MGANEISLTAGMRNNLLSLSNTSSRINLTQNRLATGKKVNSALDSPTNFFAAQTHLSRADDLRSRKDGMSEAVQAVKSADAGIKAITSLIESAKGVAQAAIATASTTDRTNYSSTFDTLLNQITQLASDSSYRGTNLLLGQSQTVEFGQATGTATLGITGLDATSTGLGISSASTASSTPTPDWTLNSTIVSNFGFPQTDDFAQSALPTPFANLGTDYTKYRIISADSVSRIGGYGTGDPTHFLASVRSGSLSVGENVTIEYYAGGVDQTTGEPIVAAATNNWSSTAGIQSSATQLESALTTLRSKSSELSANMSVVTTRQDFTDTMINTLQTGADNLTLADMNEEGANMLMLQTQQNLGITSLSMASQAAQSVMRLF
jgi:flagellin-like hook-associated protein FlgL